ncbi:g12929 [Coccomyxa viridis]|uniref:G12929 protein n=1 Tax=Coccomyxa viridis TaxID=1274662 RepID=A0ABP1GIN1_9CHLO
MLRAFRRVQQYIKHDIKEIVAPSALPEPPGEEAWRLTAAEIWKAVRLGTRDYLDTFRKEKKEQVAGGLKESGPEEPPIIDELLGAAKGGAQSVKPLLQNLYRTRASAYQRAVRSFVEGYREGLVEQPQDSSGPDVPPAAQAREKPQARSESRPTK